MNLKLYKSIKGNKNKQAVIQWNFTLTVVVQKPKQCL